MIVCTRCGEDKGKRMFRVGITGMKEDEMQIECFDCYKLNYIEQEKLFERNNEGILEPLIIRSRIMREKRHAEILEFIKSVEEGA